MTPPERKDSMRGLTVVIGEDGDYRAGVGTVVWVSDAGVMVLHPGGGHPKPYWWWQVEPLWEPTDTEIAAALKEGAK